MSFFGSLGVFLLLSRCNYLPDQLSASEKVNDPTVLFLSY